MKKYLISFFVLLLALSVLSVTVYATEQTETITVEGAEPMADVSDAGSEKSEDWFVVAKRWVSEHFSGIAVTLCAFYMACPKVGGVAAVIKTVKGLISLVGAVKFLMNDKDNPDSVMNTLKNMGDMWSAYMNDTAPVLRKLADGFATVERLETELKAKSVSEDKVRSTLLAVEESVELMAKEFSDLISISTTIPAKVKAQMEADFIAAKEHLHTSVKGALGNDGQAETADS